MQSPFLKSWSTCHTIHSGKIMTSLQREISNLKKDSSYMHNLWPLILTFTTVLRFFVYLFVLHISESSWFIWSLICRSHISEWQVRATALSTIDNKYPKHSWLHIFTNRFMFDDEDGARASMYCELFSCYVAIEAHSTLYDGQNWACLHCIKAIVYPFVIFLSSGNLFRIPFGSSIYC